MNVQKISVTVLVAYLGAVVCLAKSDPVPVSLSVEPVHNDATCTSGTNLIE